MNFHADKPLIVYSKLNRGIGNRNAPMSRWLHGGGTFFLPMIVNNATSILNLFFLVHVAVRAPLFLGIVVFLF